MTALQQSRPQHLSIATSAEAAVLRCGERLGKLTREAAGQGRRCRWALAGGSTPKALYRHLAQVTDFPWQHVDLFWGDERAVGPEDDASNYRMVADLLLSQVTPGSFERIRGELGSVEAAAHYQEVIGSEALDVAILGMGGDGHTASLFAAADALIEPGAAESPSVIATCAPSEPRNRISLSAAFLQRTSTLLFLVLGRGKATVLGEVHEQIANNEPSLVAAHVAGRHPACFWFVDSEAGASLPGRKVTRLP